MSGVNETFMLVLAVAHACKVSKIAVTAARRGRLDLVVDFERVLPPLHPELYHNDWARLLVDALSRVLPAWWAITVRHPKGSAW